MQRSMWVSVCPSVRPSVRLSRRSTAAAACICGRFARSRVAAGAALPAIDRYLLQAPALTANAGSVMLRAGGRGSTQTCVVCVCLSFFDAIAVAVE